MQVPSCENIYALTELEVLIDGQDQIDGFDPDVRSYDIGPLLFPNTALVLAVASSPSAEVWLDLDHDSSEPITTATIAGGGEFPIVFYPGQQTLKVNVKAGGLSSFYTVSVNVAGSFPCTEQGIRDAIAAGGGPHTFDCDGPTTIVTTDTIVIENDLILDGEGNLIIDGNNDHRVLSVLPGVTAELIGMTVRGGSVAGGDGAGISNGGTLTLRTSTVTGNTGDFFGGINNTGWLTVTKSTVSGNGGAGIANHRTLTLIDSVVSGNGNSQMGGLFNSWTTTVVNSTVSGNDFAGIFNFASYVTELTLTNSTVSANGGYGIFIDSYVDPAGRLTLTNSTVSGNEGAAIYNREANYNRNDYLTAANSVVDGVCELLVLIDSKGHNIESPGNTCGFDQPTDQVNVGRGQLALGPLQDNGGPTMTHSLGAGSVAIDWIPEAYCVDADRRPLTTDQRGERRPETGGTMCDVGAFEAQP